MAGRVTVIGAGPGGYQAAVRAAQLGGQVTLIERRQVGGTCLNTGCIPTKTLKASCQALSLARRLGEFGVAAAGEPFPDLAAMAARRDRVIATQVKGLGALFKAHGIELLRAEAELAGPGRVLARSGGETRELASEAVILACGSRPAELPGLARDGERILSSDDAIALKAVPPRLAVVGGGVVGCELAGIYAALGSKVTVVEALERLLPLPSLDPAASKLVTRELKKRGVAAMAGLMVEGCSRGDEGLTLSLVPSTLIDHGGRPPKPRELLVDAVLVAVGRALNSEGLARAGVELSQRGAVVVDPCLRTSLPGVLAVGDVLGPGRPMLAHVAGAEGVAAAANALNGGEAVDYTAIPQVAYTSPEVAWVGLSPAQAAAAGAEVVIGSFPLRVLGMAQAMGEIAGQATLVFQAGDGPLLGAWIVGHGAGEIIHACSLALGQGMSAEELARAVFAHPTLCESVHEAAEAAMGRCLHLAPGG